MAGVVKIEITESIDTLKKLLTNAHTAQEKEKIQTLYWLKTQTVSIVQQIAIMLGRHRVTVQTWLREYRTGGINFLLKLNQKKPGRPRTIPTNVVEKLKEELKNPEGFQSYGEIQSWLKTCFDINTA